MCAVLGSSLNTLHTSPCRVPPALPSSLKSCVSEPLCIPAPLPYGGPQEPAGALQARVMLVPQGKRPVEVPRLRRVRGATFVLVLGGGSPLSSLQGRRSTKPAREPSLEPLEVAVTSGIQRWPGLSGATSWLKHRA